MTTPISPVPAPNPAVPVGVIYAASTIPPASGVSGTTGYFNGPWIIESQTMQLTYARVPHVQLQNVTLSLSSTTPTFINQSTNLNTIINASYYKVSSNDGYETSGEIQQPQKFEFFPVSADVYGNSYGSLNGSCLGPIGVVNTSIPYYRRRPMTAAEQASTSDQLGLVAETIVGSNFIAGTSGTIYENDSWSTDNQANHYSDFRKAAVPPMFAGALTSDFDLWTQGNTPINSYVLAGGYQTGQESIQQIFAWIDDCAQAVTSSWLEKVPAQRPIASNPYDYWTGLPNHYFTGLTGYDKTRHDYS